MNEMEENNIRPDHVTFHTMFSRGYCLPSHAVDVLSKSLCSDSWIEEAFQCGLQILEKGRYLSKTGFHVLERCLIEIGDDAKLKELDKMIKKLQISVLVSRGHAMGISVEHKYECYRGLHKLSMFGDGIKLRCWRKEKRHRATG
nr:hypothetical protein [Tanacetum cinerariifolium]